MNGGTSSLKVTVNGKKYLITGIQRETSCKGLLCAIAKVTSQEEEIPRAHSQRTSEASENLLERFKGDRQLAGDVTSFNVFNSLAKDAKIIAKEASTSVKPLHKETALVADKHLKHSSSKHQKSHKKQKHQDLSKTKELITKAPKIKEPKVKEPKTKEEKNSNKEKKTRNKHRKNKETLTSTTTTTLTTEKTETTKVKLKHKHRSVDDSDIETYKRDNLRRMRNKRRVYDDSDIEIYKTLQNIVVDQSKKLTRIQSHSRELKKAAWVKELKRSSQIYYIDGKPASEQEEMVAHPLLANELPTGGVVGDEHPEIGPDSSSCSFEKDDGNDSGLPSPEYDSSESQEHPPIKNKLKETVPCNDNNNNNTTKYELLSAVVNNEKVEPANQFSVSTENNRQTEQLSNGDTLPNGFHSVNDENNGESSNSISESISAISTNELRKQTSTNNTFGVNTRIDGCDNTIFEGEITNVLHRDPHGLDDSLEGLNGEKDVLSEQKGESEEEKHMSTTTKTLKKNTKKKEDSKLFTHSSLQLSSTEESMMIDKNKNILKDSEICEREVSKMVAFNEALFKGSTNNNNHHSNNANGIGKKLEKKKFKKCDISDPVLLSPSTLKKHHNVKKVQSVLGKKAADLLRKDVVKSTMMNELPPPVTVNKEVTKEKEKYFNKKLKEIRSKASIKKSKKDNNKDKNEPEYFSKKQFAESSSLIAEPTNNGEVIKTKLESNKEKLTVVASTISDVVDGKNKKRENTELESQQEPLTTGTGINSQGGKQTGVDGEGQEQGEMLDRASERLSEKDALKADQILNEILEYEKNIKNELDQIIQCDQQGDEEHLKSTGESSTAQQQTSHTEQKQTLNTHAKSHLVESGEKEEEQIHFELVEKYMEEKQALDEISKKLDDYNYALSRLQVEIQMIHLEGSEPKSNGELEDEELHLNHEIENVKSLIRSVVDLTTYQRKEMSENMELLDNIDLEYRTQKANYDNLRSGTWRTNSKSAPRSLIKNAKVKRKNSLSHSGSDRQQSSGFV